MKMKFHLPRAWDLRTAGLTFDRELEDDFKEHYYSKSLTTSRIAIILTMVLYSVFGILDTWSAPVSKEYMWFIRYAIVLPVLLITFWITYTPLYKKRMQLVLGALALVLGLGIVAMIAIAHINEVGHSTYYAGMMLVSMACYTFIGLRLFPALFVNICLVLSYEFVAIFWHDMLSSDDGMMVFVSNNFFFITTNIIGMAAGYFLEVYHRKDFLQQRIIETEQDKTQALLHSILPSEIAEELKSNPRVIANYHDDVSILFADVVELTPLSEKLDPKELVEMLNDLFSRFDNLLVKYGVEKIKTIGDCYMAAAGIPTAREDHARILVEMGMDMLACTDNWTTKFGNKLEIRIGINSGPVVAGVIGHKKFAYDLWGDTVNLASRMESHGKAGNIQITRSCYEQIKDYFELENGGKVHVKGKGLVEIWYVKGKKDPIPVKEEALISF